MLNAFILKHIKIIELVGVLMRITSFTIVSVMEKNSPFLFVWIFNTMDAIMLTWCSLLKKDSAYILLNSFWILIGFLGIFRTIQLSH